MSVNFDDNSNHNSNSKRSNCSIIENKSAINQTNSIDLASFNNNLFKTNFNNNNNFTPLRKFRISKLFLNNSNLINKKNHLNHFLQITPNSPINNQKLKFNKIKIFDRPIYKHIHLENENNSATSQYLFNFSIGKKFKSKKKIDLNKKFLFNLKSKIDTIWNIFLNYMI